jgi:hypothetical protein
MVMAAVSPDHPNLPVPVNLTMPSCPIGRLRTFIGERHPVFGERVAERLDQELLNPGVALDCHHVEQLNGFRLQSGHSSPFSGAR